MIRWALLTIGSVATVAAYAYAYTLPAPQPWAQAAVKVMVGDGHGSGFHIGGGRIITAAHVVTGGNPVTVKAQGREPIDAEVLWLNEAYDVALIEAPKLERVNEVSVACRAPSIGARVLAIGNPLNLEFIRTEGKSASEVAKHGQFKSTFIADLTVAGGMSGGPVFDDTGSVIGLVSATAAESIGDFGSPARVPLTYVVPGSAICHLLGR